MNLPFMRSKNLGGTLVRFVTIHACDGQTDGRKDGETDTFAVGKTALRVCSAVKNRSDRQTSDRQTDRERERERERERDTA